MGRPIGFYTDEEGRKRPITPGSRAQKLAVPDLKELRPKKTEKEALREELELKSNRLLGEFRKMINASGGEVDSYNDIHKQPYGWDLIENPIYLRTNHLGDGILIPVVAIKSNWCTVEEAQRYTKDLVKAIQLIKRAEARAGVTTEEIIKMKQKLNNIK